MRNASLPSRQRGVVLFLALIVLVAMLLSGIALFRTADSGILTAGNLALQKSAVSQGDRGIEAAIDWLQANAGTVLLHEDPAEPGYVDTPFYIANALNDQPAAGQGWLAWWNAYVATHTPSVLAADPDTGHEVRYLIQRLCAANGESGSAGCARSPATEAGGGSHDAGKPGRYERPGPVYYRIIARIDGARNTTALVQAIVSL
jgi:hypothetical protein